MASFFVSSPLANVATIPEPASVFPEVARRTPAHLHGDEASAMPLPPHMHLGHFCCGEVPFPHRPETRPDVPGLNSYANKLCAHNSTHFCQNLADSNTGLCAPCAAANSSGQPMNEKKN
ncbi:unnamed protein product [Clonostachys rosea]|uniref:ShKT domain-containing protein n=1 Tax=Bionectria ochroleuca TaxID=29856 RepID=A0ABY6TQM9_BIOOC|nr:unnamed protein product [Clonostachys rosea]